MKIPKIKAQTPQEVQAYWQAFNAGRDYERKICINYFITKLESLKEVKGIGEKTFQDIMTFVNKEWDV